MPAKLWNQKSSQLLDVPTNEFGALDGTPGQVLVINADSSGIDFAPAGTGGTAGPAGPGNVLTVGTVTEGEDAAVSITGTTPNQTVNFVLPRGAQGATGPKGDTGQAGQQGLQGIQGPKGDPGIQGNQGVQGIQGPVGPQGAGLIPDGYGNLTDQFITDTETAGLTIEYVVNPAGDLRSNINLPAGIAGDQSLKIIGYSAANGWVSYGQFTGVQGPAGPQGAQGVQGPKGDPGVKGDTGPRGIQGIAGPEGPAGQQGPQGIQGPAGADGADGVTPDTSTFLQKTGDKTSGVTVFGKATKDTAVAVAAADIDVSAGGLFTKTITGAMTLTVSNATLIAGEVDSFVLELTNGAAGVVTWWANVHWEGGLAPVLTAGVDSLGFYKVGGRTQWTGFVLGLDIKAGA